MRMLKEKKHSVVNESYGVPRTTYQPSSQNLSYFDADRLPGSGFEGGKQYLTNFFINSLIGPQSFKRKGYFDEEGNPVDPTCIPPGSRFDPFYPGSIKPTFPQGFPTPHKPSKPRLPPFSGPNPDHLPKPSFQDFY